MTLAKSFRQLVLSANGDNASRAMAVVCEQWLGEVTLAVVRDEVSNTITFDLEETVRRVTPNPPAILDLCSVNGVTLQVICWYALGDTSYDKYDSEDIHDHFGFIATRALIGQPYHERRYKRSNDSSVELGQAFEFMEGMTQIIEPDVIHSVRHIGAAPGLSLRITLAPCRPFMSVFDARSGKVRETILAHRERQREDLAAILTSIDGAGMAAHVRALEARCVSTEARQGIERLLSIKPEGQGELGATDGR